MTDGRPRLRIAALLPPLLQVRLLAAIEPFPETIDLKSPCPGGPAQGPVSPLSRFFTLCYDCTHVPPQINLPHPGVGSPNVSPCMASSGCSSKAPSFGPTPTPNRGVGGRSA